MNIIAIEGIRGTGKSTLLNQLGEKYPSLLKHNFPTDETIGILKERNYDMEKMGHVLTYNLQFVADFMHFHRVYGIPSYIENPIIIDRYILSNLAHFKYDLYQLNGGPHLWEGISEMLYSMYNDYFVEKPKLIIYLKTNKYLQPNAKFDDGLYKGQEHELEWFYNTELGNLHNRLNIPLYTVEALKPETFQNVESVIKRMGYL